MAGPCCNCAPPLVLAQCLRTQPQGSCSGCFPADGLPVVPPSPRFFIRGQNERAAASDHMVAAQRRARLTPYDRLLKQFRHRDALTAALATKHAEVVASVLEELAARGGLDQALGGRDAAGLLPLLRFLVKYIGQPRHSKLCCHVAHRLLDSYASVVGLSPEVDGRLVALKDRLAEELRVSSALMELQGALEPLLAASLAGTLQ
ncbi:UTP15 C terminal-domain-containing protein [Dunaliella salina]|uniref:UTP15 C terminal-domain-containing protein n=1 Tax=Dunaliella salina TaxID=3046 RepID=A0ABQ7GHH2_DUNSA|nr:UTP15 C terminal-domain-containing protein [Dunaliella salina]|eukprot:KAF5834054.1 UTP15 C terminal-domain-containing protein [Dunaliella salina]